MSNWDGGVAIGQGSGERDGIYITGKTVEEGEDEGYLL